MPRTRRPATLNWHSGPLKRTPCPGPGDCQEFELSLTAKGLTNLFNFLSGASGAGCERRMLLCRADHQRRCQLLTFSVRP